MPDVEFGGESFACSDSIALMALMRFAHVASAGTDSNDLAGLAAMYDLLEQVIAADDWDRFQQAALRTKARGDELMAVVGEVIRVLSDRPTGRPSDSSGGPTSMPLKSEAASSSPILREVKRQEDAGRPDRAIYLLDHLSA